MFLPNPLVFPLKPLVFLQTYPLFFSQSPLLSILFCLSPPPFLFLHPYHATRSRLHLTTAPATIQLVSALLLVSRSGTLSAQSFPFFCATPSLACLAIGIDSKSASTWDGSSSSKSWSVTPVSMRMVTLCTSYSLQCTFLRASSSASFPYSPERAKRPRLRRTQNVVVTYWSGISIFGSHTILAKRTYVHDACVKKLLRLNRLIGIQRAGKAPST